MTLREALMRYSKEVSSLKKGAPQEHDRIRRLAASPLGGLAIADVTSRDIALWRESLPTIEVTGPVRVPAVIVSK